MSAEPIMLEITQRDITKVFQDGGPWTIDPDGSEAKYILRLGKEQPWSLAALPYSLEGGKYQFYSGQRRDEYPTLRATLTNASSISIDDIDRLAAAADKLQEETMKPEHKDLIIELMAEEIGRLRYETEQEKARGNRNADERNKYYDETIRLKESERLLARKLTAQEDAAALISNRLNEERAKNARLEAALQKSKKGLHKKKR